MVIGRHVVISDHCPDCNRQYIWSIEHDNYPEAIEYAIVWTHPVSRELHTAILWLCSVPDCSGCVGATISGTEQIRVYTPITEGL